MDAVGLDDRVHVLRKHLDEAIEAFIALHGTDTGDDILLVLVGLTYAASDIINAIEDDEARYALFDSFAKRTAAKCRVALSTVNTPPIVPPAPTGTKH